MLFRHFLARFFDSEFVTEPGQTTTALIAASCTFAPWFPVIAGPLREKYLYAAKLPTPDLYRVAVRADELWLITLIMSALALLVAIKWQTLFPSLTDYRVLGWLPLRPSEIFGAKLAALLVVVTGAIAVIGLLPAAIFPAVSNVRWATQPLTARFAILLASSSAGAYFTVLNLAALQGVLLNLLRPAWFARASASLQGLLAGASLLLLVLSFSIQPEITATVLRPGLARWLPPVWFLGLHQVWAGEADLQMQVLAHRAVAALAIAFALLLGTYALSCRRHRQLLMEGVRAPGRRTSLLDRLMRNPRQLAIVGFVVRTLSGSAQHRTIVMAYAGFGAAIAVSMVAGLQRVLSPERLTAAYIVYAQVVVVMFLLLGVRHAFTIPIEWKANWLFRLCESDGRREWMDAVDRVVVSGGALLLAAAVPFEVRLLGLRGIALSVLCAAAGLLAYEVIFKDWEKLPFTCSNLPGKRPMWISALQLFAVLGAMPVASGVLIECLYRPWMYVFTLLALVTAWTRLRSIRHAGWDSLRLLYDEAPDPAVQSLGLLH